MADIIWGAAFVAQSTGGAVIGAYSFNCIRSLMGALVLVPVILLMDRLGISTNRPRTREERRTLWRGGIICGVALCFASNFQQLGIIANAHLVIGAKVLGKGRRLFRAELGKFTSLEIQK